jgi:hypothetical protein
MSVEEEIQMIKEAITAIKDNHLSHIEESLNEMSVDISELKTRMVAIEEIKDLLKANFSKMITALITIAAAATGANLMM